MTTTITPEHAIDLLRKARDDYGPGYRDPVAVANLDRHPSNADECEYLYDDGTMCIAGHVLNQLGVPLRDADDEAWGAFADVAVILEGTVSFDPLAITAINTAQTAQDRGRTWGEAVAEAERKLTTAGAPA